MRIIVTSLYVDDQEKALQFYTEKLGFIKRQDIANGDYRWLTVVSPDDRNGTELVLEPNDNPIAQEYQEKLAAAEIPATLFAVDDVQKTYDQLIEAGVAFLSEPVVMDVATFAIFNDTVGNLIQIVER